MRLVTCQCMLLCTQQEADIHENVEMEKKMHKKLINIHEYMPFTIAEEDQFRRSVCPNRSTSCVDIRLTLFSLPLSVSS